MTRKEKRELKNKASDNSIVFLARSKIIMEDLDFFQENTALNEIVTDIMTLPIAVPDCRRALEELKKKVLAFEASDECCDAYEKFADQFEYEMEDLIKVLQIGINNGECVSMHTMMRMDLLETLLQCLHDNFTMEEDLIKCIDKWITSIEGDEE